jgi:hypothetical protein
MSGLAPRLAAQLITSRKSKPQSDRLLGCDLNDEPDQHCDPSEGNRYGTADQADSGGSHELWFERYVQRLHAATFQTRFGHNIFASPHFAFANKAGHYHDNAAAELGDWPVMDLALLQSRRGVCVQQVRSIRR